MCQCRGQSYRTFPLHQSLTGAGQLHISKRFHFDQSFFTSDSPLFCLQVLASGVDQIPFMNQTQPASQSIRIFAVEFIKLSHSGQVRLLNDVRGVNSSGQSTVHRSLSHQFQVGPKLIQ